MRYFLFGCFLIACASPIFGQTLVFPHLADGAIGDGTRWATEIDLINASSETQTARLSFYNPDGTAKCFSFPRHETDLQGCPEPLLVTLAPLKIRSIIIDSAFDRQVNANRGWAFIEGSGGIEALLSFRRIAGAFDGKIISEASFTPQSPAAQAEFFPKTNVIAAGGPSTENTVYLGLAIANSSSLDEAAGEVQLVDSSAQIAARYRFTLPPRSQVAAYLEEIFGAVADDRCYARIVMARGTVCAIGLRTVGTVISSIPPFP